MNRENTFRGRLNSWFLSLLEGYMDKTYGKRKRMIFKSLPQQIVEIGPGTGANFRYYPQGITVIAIEPNPMMHARLKANANRYRLQLQIRSKRGEEIDLENDSVEAVVGTLVLCTVENPKRVVSEVRRILRPGGRYIFLEHVAAPMGTRLRAVQNFLHKPWHWLFEGCNLNRNTHSLLTEQAFSSVDMGCFMLQSMFAPVTPHIFGLATK